MIRYKGSNGFVSQPFSESDFSYFFFSIYCHSLVSGVGHSYNEIYCHKLAFVVLIFSLTKYNYFRVTERLCILP